MFVRASPTWAVNAFSVAREARRRDRSPPRENTWYDETATALLVPAAGHAPTWMGPMVPPALVRGSRTEIPTPVRPEQPVWPYADDKVQPEEVSLFYPGTPKPDPVTPMQSPKAVEHLIRDDSSLLHKSPSGTRHPGMASSHRVRPSSQAGQRRRIQSPAEARGENCYIQTNTSIDTNGAQENTHQDQNFSPSDSEKVSVSQVGRRTALEGRPASRGGPLGAANWMHEDRLLNASASAKVLDRSGSIATLAPSPSKDSFLGSELENQICDSLRPRTDNLHWEKKLVSKPPIEERRPEKPARERPAHTPAFLRAMEKAMTPKHSPVQGRLKSSKLLGAHHRIRRAGQVPEQPSEHKNDKSHSGCTACIAGVELRPVLQKEWFKAIKPDEMAPEDGSMIVRVLGTVDDTPSSLKEGIELILNSSEMLEALGGSRHPTTLISGRTLGVLNRKLDVLSPLLEAVEALQKLCDNKKPSLIAIRSGASTKEVAGAAFGIVQKLKDSTHPGGRPEKDDRSNFARFIETFKLPSNHMTLKRGWELVRDEAYDWADVLYEIAESAVDAERQEEEQATLKNHQPKASIMVTRLIDFVGCLGVDIYRPQIEKAFILAQDHRAAAVLRYAEAAVIDVVSAKTEESDGQIKKAELIEHAIQLAVDWGLSPKHPSIDKAQGVATHLRSTILKFFAKELMDRIEHGKPGSAGRVADEIDEAVKEAIEVFGVPLTDKNVEEARTMSLQARSEENRLQKKLGKDKKSNRSGG